MRRQMMGQQFGMQPLNFTEFVVKGSFGLISFLLIIIVPMLTMRLFAEEKKSGTFELLATCPVTDWGMVIGKYLAAVTVLVVFLIISLAYPVTFGLVGEVEWSIVITGYLALFLLGLAYVALGLFASSLTQNQIIAAIVTFCALLTFFFVGDLGIGRASGLDKVLGGFSLLQHSDSLIQGSLRSEDIVYFVLFSVGFLFLTNYVLESRRWRV
jgi:ABC-2 type transport system permease protein